jgi:hypothetical protein
MARDFLFRVNGTEFVISASPTLSSRLSYFRDPIISGFEVHTINNPDFTPEILRAFFDVCVSGDYSKIPADPADREVWAVLGDRFGADDLLSYLAKYTLGPNAPAEIFIKHFVDLVLSGRFNRLMPEDPAKCNLIVQGAMGAPKPT